MDVVPDHCLGKIRSIVRMAHHGTENVVVAAEFYFGQVASACVSYNSSSEERNHCRKSRWVRLCDFSDNHQN